MIVTAVETLQAPEHPMLLWVRVHTDDGLVGLGETIGQPGAAARIVHDMLAPLLIGADPLRIEHFWDRAARAIDYHGTGGAEMRALSALDIALWDLLGKAAGQPLHVLLGGACRDAVPVYATCGGRDRDAFLERPAELARELIAEGWPAAKIWPFDEFAAATNGQRISARDLALGVERVAAMREDDALDIAIEGHALWSLPAAIRIAQALEPLGPMWLEDMIRPQDAAALAQLRAATSIPVIASERLLTRWGAQAVIEARAADIVMFDIAWTGGLTEGRKVAVLAATRQLPVAPHNCGGPVLHVANAHLCAALPNLFLLETVRAFALGFFGEVLTATPALACGRLALPGGPGLGTELRPELLARGDLARERSSHAGGAQLGAADGDPWRTAEF